MLKDTESTAGGEAADRTLPQGSRPFTDRYLAALRPRRSRYEVLDPRRQGLTLRVTEKGAKTFCFRYKRGGRGVRVVIGPYPLVTLQKAYETHAELTKRVLAGEAARSPGTPGVRGRGAALPVPEPVLTVGDLAQEFTVRYLRVERKRPEEAEQAIEGNILRHWRTRDAKAITRRDGILLPDKIVDRGSPTMANRVSALLSQMFRFAVTRGMLDGSPFVALGRPGGTEKARKRRLDEREIRIFWKKLTRSRLNAEVRIALKLILVTAQRPGEVSQAAWSEFDLKRRIWTIPAERSKNGQPHEVALSDLALALIRHLRRRFGEAPYLVPSRCWRVKDDGPVTVRALSQGIRDRRKHFGIANFTPHDLRRTAASLMTASGIPRLHVEKVLNHTIDDVAEIYDRHDYSSEKRLALARLGERIDAILRRSDASHRIPSD
ncbi:MAG: tyrosine-type recombinase/integrase [Proteobacteria bacterium]|nr:tyrosine-type recombinase/integrase [Pseudomonadota bacterium]